MSDNSLFLLILMVFALGLRHGLDLDHLATIDSITRTVREQYYSKFVGILFSLGHGLVVIIISLLIGVGLVQNHIPSWLDGVGKGISIFFLIVFGMITLWNVIKTPASPNTTHLSQYVSNKIADKKYKPLLIIFIGALFAFSFDTFSQVALFSISASIMSGWVLSCLLGLIFMLGMMMADGLNGLLVSSIIKKADKKSLLFSRAIGGIIAVFSLSIGFINVFK